jgi:hypothetical protein
MTLKKKNFHFIIETKQRRGIATIWDNCHTLKAAERKKD